MMMMMVTFSLQGESKNSPFNFCLYFCSVCRSVKRILHDFTTKCC